MRLANLRNEMGARRFFDSEYRDDLYRVSGELNTYETSLGTLGSSLMAILDMVTNIERKRFFLDADPVEQYASNTVLPPQYIRDIIQLPYPSMYLEFSRGVEIGEPEQKPDGTFYQDKVKGIFLDSDENALRFQGPVALENDADVAKLTDGFAPITALIFMDTPTGRKSEEIYSSAVRQSSGWGWRAFYMNLQTGKAYTHMEHILTGYDPSVSPPDGVLEMMRGTGAIITSPNDSGRLISSGYDSVTMVDSDPIIEVGAFGMSRYVGWWERNVLDTARTISWLMVFLTAKGIHAYPSTVLPRAERKLLKKRPMLRTPQPFHIVNIGNPTDSGSGNGTKRHQTIRYDVRGHLRYGRHKLKNGDYRATIEWIQPHQRGLANARYVPPTYTVSPDRKVAIEQD